MEYPDLKLLEDVVAPAILDALRKSDEQLKKAGVRHALVGALAVGAYGYPRHSKDVDYLVGDEAYVHHGGGIVSIASGIPISVGNIAIDELSIRPDEPFLVEALEAAPESEGIRILPIEALIYLKLKSPRMKDAVDIIELFKAGADEHSIRTYMNAYAPTLAKKLDDLIKKATD